MISCNSQNLKGDFILFVCMFDDWMIDNFLCELKNLICLVLLKDLQTALKIDKEQIFSQGTIKPTRDLKVIDTKTCFF